MVHHIFMTLDPCMKPRIFETEIFFSLPTFLFLVAFILIYDYFLS